MILTQQGWDRNSSGRCPAFRHHTGVTEGSGAVVGPQLAWKGTPSECSFGQSYASWEHLGHSLQLLLFSVRHQGPCAHRSCRKCGLRFESQDPEALVLPTQTGSLVRLRNNFTFSFQNCFPFHPLYKFSLSTPSQRSPPKTHLSLDMTLKYFPGPPSVCWKRSHHQPMEFQASPPL